MERAVQELVHPVVDRSIKIAMTTCEQIIRKDFALDSEESRMRVAAHHMMRNLTAGMAMITCREPLLMSIATNLKNSFAAALRVSQIAFMKVYILTDYLKQLSWYTTFSTSVLCHFIRARKKIFCVCVPFRHQHPNRGK